MKIVNAVVEKCRKALELCPHEKGTVNVMCRVCALRSECCGLEQTGWSAQRGSPDLGLAIRQANSLANRDGSEMAVI